MNRFEKVAGVALLGMLAIGFSGSFGAPKSLHAGIFIGTVLVAAIVGRKTGGPEVNGGIQKD